MIGRVSDGMLSLEPVARFPNGPVEGADGLHWDFSALYAHILDGLREAVAARARRSRASASTRGRWTTAWSRTAGCSPSRSTTATSARRAASTRCTRSCRSTSSTAATACSSCRSTRCTSTSTEQGLSEADVALLIPDLVAFLLTGRARRRAHERVDHGPRRRPHRRVGPRARGAARASRHPSFPPLVDPGTHLGRLTRRRAKRGRRPARGHRRRLARHRVGDRRRAAELAERRVHLVRHVGARRRRARRTRRQRRGARGELHERGRRRRARALPPQRHGTLAAERVGARVGGRGRRAHRPSVAARGRGIRRRRHPAVRRERSAAVGARRHARAHRRRAARGRRRRCRPPARRSRARSSRASRRRSPAPCTPPAASPVARSTSIHIVGGGALNRLLCQATADRSGLPVLAGPVEATALGNVLVQARAHGWFGADASLETLRALVVAAFPRSGSNRAPASDQRHPPPRRARGRRGSNAPEIGFRPRMKIIAVASRANSCSPTGPAAGSAVGSGGGTTSGKTLHRDDDLRGGKHAGVSPATVSRVMNGRFLGEPAIAERVHASAIELNYSPNHLARSFALGQTNAIAFLVPDLGEPVVPGGAHGPQQGRRGRRLPRARRGLSGVAEDEPLLAAEVRRRCDALVLCAPRMSEDDLVRATETLGPVVLMNRSSPRVTAPTLSVDSRSGFESLAQHLYALGHRRLVYVEGPDGVANQNRLRGLADFAQTAADVTIVNVPRRRGQRGRPRRGRRRREVRRDRRARVQRPGRGRPRARARSSAASACPTTCRSRGSTTSRSRASSHRR